MTSSTIIRNWNCEVVAGDHVAAVDDVVSKITTTTTTTVAAICEEAETHDGTPNRLQQQHPCSFLQGKETERATASEDGAGDDALFPAASSSHAAVISSIVMESHYLILLRTQEHMNLRRT